MRNDGHGDRHKQGPHVNNRLESGEIPLHDEQCGGDRHVCQSAAIGPVGKKQNKLESTTFLRTMAIKPNPGTCDSQNSLLALSFPIMDILKMLSDLRESPDTPWKVAALA